MANNPDKNLLDKDSNNTSVCSDSHKLMLKFTLLAQHTNQNRFNSLLITSHYSAFQFPPLQTELIIKVWSWVSNVVSVVYTMQKTLGIVKPL